MKRTLYALLICVGIVGIVLAVSLGVEKHATPVTAEMFISRMWSGDAQVVMEVGHEDLQLGYGPNRLVELFKRFAHQFGPYKGIKEEKSRTVTGLGDTELELVVECEKANAVVWLLLKRTADQLTVADFDVQVPPSLAVPASTKALNRLLPPTLLRFVQGDPVELYDYFGRDLRREKPFRSFKKRWSTLLDILGDAQEVEAVGEPQAQGPDQYVLVHRAPLDAGGWLVMTSEWRYRGLYWNCIRFDVTQEKE